MTSFAFILGVFPLVIAEGAGAEMRRTLGTAVFAGMIGVTVFGLFLTPVFYYVVRRLTERKAALSPSLSTATAAMSLNFNDCRRCKMTTNIELIKRIDAEFSAAEKRLNQFRAQQVQEYQDRQERLEQFERTVDELRKRMGAAARRTRQEIR